MAKTMQYADGCEAGNGTQAGVNKDDARLLFVMALERACARAYEEATPLLQVLVTCYPESEWADDAHMILGLSHFYLGANEKAVKSFRTLASDYGSSEYAIAARQQLTYLESGRYL